MKQKKMSLALTTFIGFGLGIVIGLIFQEKATVLKPLGTIFLNMIKMIVVPLVFCSITAVVTTMVVARSENMITPPAAVAAKK